MLTHAEREKITRRAMYLEPKGIEAMAEALHREGFPVAAQHARYLATQKRMAMQAASVPLEITGERTTPRPAQAPEAGPVLSPAAIQAAKYGSYAVAAGSLLYGAGALLVEVVFPFIGAMFAAIGAAAVVAAPYIAGMVGLFFTGWILISGARGEKKTVQSPSGGNVYNIFINQGPDGVSGTVRESGR